MIFSWGSKDPTDPWPVMHAGPFSVNRRRHAQNGTGVAVFGGVGREISKIHIPISHDNKLLNNRKK